MILFAVLAALIAALSPFAGMIFTIYFGWKFQSKLYVFLSVFIGSSALFYFANILDPIRILDIIVGIGLVSFLFIERLATSANYLQSLLRSATAVVIYAISRQIIFFEQLQKTAENFVSEYDKILASTFESNPEQLQLLTDATAQVKPLFTDYYIGVWSFIMISGIALAALLVSRKSGKKWHLKKVQMPFLLIYLLIGSLLLLLIPNTEKHGVNGVLIVAPFFLIEGASILAFYWGDYFQKSKFLLIILILAILINPYLMLLIMLIGLFDIWFNFRKINNGG
ncbi:MAG: DUF2232 domain-containing protein [Candidatus Cloacimonadales bacterium]